MLHRRQGGKQPPSLRVDSDAATGLVELKGPEACEPSTRCQRQPTDTSRCNLASPLGLLSKHHRSGFSDLHQPHPRSDCVSIPCTATVCSFRPCLEMPPAVAGSSTHSHSHLSGCGRFTSSSTSRSPRRDPRRRRRPPCKRRTRCTSASSSTSPAPRTWCSQRTPLFR